MRISHSQLQNSNITIIVQKIIVCKLKMFDTKRFIYEIEGQPPLYDKKSKEYSKRDVKARCWVKIAETMVEGWIDFDMKTKDKKVKELMKRWKAIRDCFVRYRRSITAAETGQAASKKKKYIFHDQLLFLLPHMKGNSNTVSNIAPLHSEETQMEDIENSAHEEILADGAINVRSSPRSTTLRNQAATKHGKRADFEKNLLSTSKDLNNILDSSLEWQKSTGQQNSDKKGNKAFLLSFAPVLDNLPLTSSMFLRGQISQLFSNYFSENENRQEPSTSSNSAPATPNGNVFKSEEKC